MNEPCEHVRQQSMSVHNGSGTVSSSCRHHLKASCWYDTAGFDWNLVFKWDFMTSEEISRRSSNMIAPIRFVFLTRFLEWMEIDQGNVQSRLN